jgi:hypothetical protein
MSDINTLQWIDEHDDHDQPYWEAVSICHDDECPFLFRITQVGEEFRETSDAELIQHAPPRTWTTLQQAQAEMQADHERMLAAESVSSSA